jgi:hypothetical protein
MTIMGRGEDGSSVFHQSPVTKGTFSHDNVKLFIGGTTMKEYALSSITILVFCFITFTSFAVEPDDILGSWLTEGGDSCVEIFKKDDLYFAKITSLREPNFTEGEVEGMDGKPRVDIHNPDESLRD